MRIRIAVLALLIVLCLTAVSGSAEPKHTVWHGDRELPRIAITMDDCYNSEDVAAALDLCEAYGITMTFFVLGDAIKDEDRDMWLRAIRLGCEIGNHTYTHADLTQLGSGGIQSQLMRTQRRLNEMLGVPYPMRVMRPPFGHVMRLSANVVTPMAIKLGYDYVVLWDVSQTDPEKAVPAVRNGSILLYHARPKDVECIRTILPILLEKGFEPVTVSGLLGEYPPATVTDLSMAMNENN